jgi:hypothetical protein
MWTADDRTWARERGVDLAELEDQLRRLQAEDETLAIDRPATTGDGVHWLDVNQLATFTVPADRLTTFVPASGAATRMFASLVKAHAAGLDDLDALDQAIAAGRTDVQAARDALAGRDLLAIGGTDGVGATLERWIGTDALHRQPKGLVPLHRYADGTRTAALEHLLEAAALTGERAPRVHFTVQAGHEDAFLSESRRAAAHGVEAVVSTSVQSPGTDTVAMAPDGAVFRDDDGHPLMRPGGHGSLLQNLEALGADLVVVKNIDNVTRDDNRAAVVQWRRGLVDRLVELETRVHAHLADLHAGAEPGPAMDFAVRTFGRHGHGPNARAMAIDALDRPLRVAAVVRNEGQPGGGPFWVREPDGTSTPQIMESAQIDRNDPGQRALFAAATHFNPVDMVLALRDRHGEPYPLARFVDPRGWLRADKTHAGRPLRALERPGLWNGAMAGWNTVFVEVPAWTFRPVKEVRDLLGEGHRPPGA